MPARTRFSTVLARLRREQGFAAAFSSSRLRKHRDEWLSRRGKSVHQAYLILRAPQSRFRDCLAHLSDVERVADSELYLVEGKVTRLFDPAAGSRPKDAR